MGCVNCSRACWDYPGPFDCQVVYNKSTCISRVEMLRCIVESKDLVCFKRLGCIYFSVILCGKALVWLLSVTARRWNWRTRAVPAVGLSKTIPKQPSFGVRMAGARPVTRYKLQRWVIVFLFPEVSRANLSFSLLRLSIDCRWAHVICLPCSKKLFDASIFNKFYMLEPPDFSKN